MRHIEGVRPGLELGRLVSTIMDIETPGAWWEMSEEKAWETIKTIRRNWVWSALMSFRIEVWNRRGN